MFIRNGLLCMPMPGTLSLHPKSVRKRKDREREKENGERNNTEPVAQKIILKNYV